MVEPESLGVVGQVEDTGHVVHADCRDVAGGREHDLHGFERRMASVRVGAGQSGRSSSDENAAIAPRAARVPASAPYCCCCSLSFSFGFFAAAAAAAAGAAAWGAAAAGAGAGAAGPLWPSPTEMPKSFHCPSTGA